MVTITHPMAFSPEQIQRELQQLRRNRCQAARQLRQIRGALATHAELSPEDRRLILRHMLDDANNQQLLRPCRRSISQEIARINEWVAQTAEPAPIRHGETYTCCGLEDARDDNRLNALQYADILEHMLEIL
jgi:hypothetical protein